MDLSLLIDAYHLDEKGQRWIRSFQDILIPGAHTSTILFETVLIASGEWKSSGKSNFFSN